MLKLRKTKELVAEQGSNKKATPTKPQGITAKGNALQTIGGIALLIALIPTLLGFAYLALLREPALQAQQIDRIATSYAMQQAAHIHAVFNQLESRVKSAALSPLALSAIASKSEQDINLVEKAVLDYFPGVISLRVIPIGELGTADFAGGNRGLRNHIEVDLVRRASEAEEIKPEAYKFEGKWLISLGALVQHPRIDDQRAVIFVTIDNQQLSRELQPLNGSDGKFTLEQSFSGPGSSEKWQTIASGGRGDVNAFTRFAAIPNAPWRIAFSPSDALIQELTIKQLPLYSVLGLVVFALLSSLAVILILFPRKLGIEIDRVISASDQKTPYTLAIPELVSIAKQLRRATLRALWQSSSSSWDIPKAEVENIESEAPGPTDPLFQSESILEQEEATTNLNLDLNTSDANTAPDADEDLAFPKHIFRAYDIRGDAEEELTDKLIADIGAAIGSIAGEMGEQALIIGCDGRASSPRIKSALMRAIMESGRDIIDIGLVPTPLLYFATQHLNCQSGVMITGSHNPASHNGLKIVLKQKTIAAGGIQEIRERAKAGSFSTGNGRVAREDIVPAYMEEVLQDIAIAVPLKIVVDASNGATSEIAPRLLEELGCEVERLNCQIDGLFPGHPPDTSNEDNLTDLVDKVVEINADFGVAFDGDGDRLAVVTPSGQIVRSDVLLMLYAQDVVSRNPGADVVFDVKCSRQLSKLITRHGGRPVLWKTGHAFMKEKIQETQALLGGEFSGHIFFGERWYGFDDGMYAAARLAEILSTHGESLDDSISAFLSTVNTPEIIIPVSDEYKFELVTKIIENADFSAGKVNTMDGIRVDFSNGWGLVRASNTGPALTARFEADTQENLDIIQDEFRAQIALIDPDVDLNF